MTRRAQQLLLVGASVALVLGLTAWSWQHFRAPATPAENNPSPSLVTKSPGKATKPAKPKTPSDDPGTIADVPLMKLPWRTALDKPAVKLATVDPLKRPSKGPAVRPAPAENRFPKVAWDSAFRANPGVPDAKAAPLTVTPLETPKGQLFVRSLAEDLQHRVWVGTEDDGVWCYDAAAAKGQQWKQFTTKDGLGDDNAYATICDRLGRIWIGHLNHGVSVYNGQKWQNYDVIDGPLGERVFAVATSPVDGDVWIATSAGITRYSLKNDNWTHYTRGDGLPSDQANSLTFAADGTLYVGTQCDGIAIGQAQDDYKSWRVVRGADKLPLVPNGEGLPTNLINQVLVMRDGTVYAATTTGLAWSKDKGQTWAFTRGLDWADKVRGLYGGPPAGWQQTSEPELAEDYLTTLAEDEAGNLWVGTRSRGLQVLDRSAQGGQNTVRRYTNASYVTALLAQPGRETLVGLYPGQLREVVMTSPGSKRSTASDQRESGSVAELPKNRTPISMDECRVLLEKARRLADNRTVSYMKDDWRTRGDWVGHYGRQLAVCAAMGAPFDHIDGNMGAHFAYGVRLGPNSNPNDSTRYWVHWLQTENPNSLVCKVAGGRRQSDWDDHGEAYAQAHEGPDLEIPVWVPKGKWAMSLYFFNKDGHDGNNRCRDYTVSVWECPQGPRPPPNAACLAQCRITGFHGGVYKTFYIAGGKEYLVRIGRNYSFNTICSGLFFDAIAGADVPRDAADRKHLFRQTRPNGEIQFLDPDRDVDTGGPRKACLDVIGVFQAVQTLRQQAPEADIPMLKLVYWAVIEALTPHLHAEIADLADRKFQIDLRMWLSTCYTAIGLFEQSEKLRGEIDRLWRTTQSGSLGTSQGDHR